MGEVSDSRERRTEIVPNPHKVIHPRRICASGLAFALAFRRGSFLFAVRERARVAQFVRAQ